MKELQLLALATFFSLIIGGGLFLLVEGDSIPGFGSNYSPAFKTLDVGIDGPTDVLVERKNYIFRDKDDYLAFWELLYGNDPTAQNAPFVNFTRDHVIAVVAGVKSSGGYDIYIRDIIEGIDERLIETIIISPDENCAATGALTNPYHIVVVKKTDKPLRAIEVREEYSCGE
tara:strand:- start:36931 stop:37446 length:516 start_codon:yes stop_codon:yes gene_type:complete